MSMLQLIATFAAIVLILIVAYFLRSLKPISEEDFYGMGFQKTKGTDNVYHNHTYIVTVNINGTIKVFRKFAGLAVTVKNCYAQLERAMEILNYKAD